MKTVYNLQVHFLLCSPHFQKIPTGEMSLVYIGAPQSTCAYLHYKLPMVADRG